ncbi:hypothetical protein MED01_002394 [Micromonospora sp. MED01]|uniref:hypothetical protein n=1 Tax=Micromonospora alfalfae TaxID=2911212 RepID=UPI001EE79EB7|nr:hypothetical protein [Micromonospora alfalfae]MCG5464229.1 hypothetical protein [Micromonospora alfalfae]
MPKWIRVRDTSTGHQFDLEARALEHRRGVEPVGDPERWPDIEGPRVGPRPAKPFVGKDGLARSFNPDATSDGGAVDTSQVPGDSEHADSDEGHPDNDAPADGGRPRRSKPTSTPADAPTDSNAPKE